MKFFYNWLQNQSKETWERIKFVRHSPHLKIFEVTITQNILFNFNLFCRKHPNHAQMFEAKNEKRNGNDIELYVKCGSKYLFLPTQAKLLYSDNRYKKINHKNQRISLINYAKKKKGIPLYLLYNYTNKTKLKKAKCLGSCNLPIEQYGCSLARVKGLSTITSRTTRLGKFVNRRPVFDDIHSTYALPHG